MGRDRAEKGVAYVEFLLVFFPLFVLFLVIAQWVILGTTALGVRHAASAAARSASVVLPDDPTYYSGQAVNQILPSTTCSPSFDESTQSVVANSGVGMSGELPCEGGRRLAVIRFVAATRMLPFSPNVSSLVPAGLHRGAGTVAWLVGAVAYSYGATAVTFPAVPGGDELKSTWEAGEEVRARVSYLAYCGIPIARLLMCDSSYSLSAGVDIERATRDASDVIAANSRISRAGAMLKTMSTQVISRAIFSALVASGKRFQVLSAESSLPLHTASYDYPKAR